VYFLVTLIYEVIKGVCRPIWFDFEWTCCWNESKVYKLIWARFAHFYD